VVICDEDSLEFSSKIVSDDKGGIIAVWLDERTSVQWDVYCQRVDSNGICMWDSNGIFIYTIADTSQEPTWLHPQICSDGRNGAIVTSQAYRNSNWDIYCQRIDSLGVIQWDSGGLPVCIDSAYQGGRAITTDGQGGAIIAWADNRNGACVYSQRVGDVQAIKLEQGPVNKEKTKLLFSPNPFSKIVRIRIKHKQSHMEKMRVAIYDISGRKVRNGLPIHNKSANLTFLDWNGTDDESNMVNDGIYFVKIEIGNEKFISKIIKLNCKKEQ
jgi:hypothetical protein